MVSTRRNSTVAASAQCLTWVHATMNQLVSQWQSKLCSSIVMVVSPIKCDQISSGSLSVSAKEKLVSFSCHKITPLYDHHWSISQFPSCHRQRFCFSCGLFCTSGYWISFEFYSLLTTRSGCIDDLIPSSSESSKSERDLVIKYRFVKFESRKSDAL